MTESPLIDRIAAKLGISCYAARKVRKAFVEALREEVEARYAEKRGPDVIPFDGAGYPNAHQPLIIAGLGSFKMRTRPAAQFDSFKCAPRQSVMGDEGPRPTITKPPARRLVFTSKWEPIDP